MTTTVHPLLPQPFKPLRSFLDYATGDEQLQLKDFAMSEAFGVRPAEKLVQQLVAARTAAFLGHDPKPFVDEAIIHLKAVANEHGFAVDPIDAPATDDEAARLYAEGHGMQEAAE